MWFFQASFWCSIFFENCIRSNVYQQLDSAVESINELDFSENNHQIELDEPKKEPDLNHDGDQEDTITLSIEYDPSLHPETNGYYGTYLDLYLAEFTENLQWYLDNLNYAEGWTWFDKSGAAMSNEAAAAMTSADKAQAFIEGRYAKSTETGGMGGPTGGGAPGGMTGTMGEMTGTPPAGMTGGTPPANNNGANQMAVGTPNAGTTQSAASQTDSANYANYNEMLSAYEDDIASIKAGDEYGNNIVSLYNPLNYIGAKDTQNPTWTRIVMGAAEGDMSMLNSINLQIAWLNAGVDSVIEWQWDGGHVPSEVLGNSLSLYVDEMYGEYVVDAVAVTKPAATVQTENGTATAATGTDISSWVKVQDLTKVSFSLADTAAYRTAKASKEIPGFDVMDYGQEDYVFGTSDTDARHWDQFVLDALKKYKSQLEPLFNAK